MASSNNLNPKMEVPAEIQDPTEGEADSTPNADQALVREMATPIEAEEIRIFSPLRLEPASVTEMISAYDVPGTASDFGDDLLPAANSPTTPSAHRNEVATAASTAFQTSVATTSRSTSSAASSEPDTEVQSYLCPVCNNQTGHHAHYGGYSCQSCRAFFRRSVLSKSYSHFQCSSGNCLINSQSWRSCKSCRFKRCLQSGMKPEWVLDKKERQPRNDRRPPSEGANTFASQNQTQPILDIRTSDFTNNELLLILAQVDIRKMSMSKSLMPFYAANASLFRELVGAVYFDKILMFDTYKHVEQKWPCTMEDFIIKDCQLASLTEHDRAELLRANFPLLQVFIQSVILINRHHFKATALANILRRSLITNPKDEDKSHIEVLSTVLKDLHIGPKDNTPKGLDYSQVFASPWADSKDLEERHAYLTKEMSSWPVNPKDPAQNVDKVQLFLLANIIMLSTDSVTVREYAKITRIQELYMTMLHRYLKYKYRKNYNTLFAKGLMISSLAREAKEIRQHRLPV